LINAWNTAGSELFSIAVFSVEYLLRTWICVENQRYRRPVAGRLRYMVSPMAIVDLVAVLPYYLGVMFNIDTRFLRVLRLFRIFKLSRHFSAMSILLAVIRKELATLVSAIFILMVLVVLASGCSDCWRCSVCVGSASVRYGASKLSSTSGEA